MDINAILDVLKVVVALGTGASLPVKMIVDVLRQNLPDLPGKAYAGSAFGFGVLFAEGAVYISTPAMTGQDGISGLLAGFVAGALAVGATELHKTAQARRDEAKAGQG
jgi:hypothetical protein